MTAAVDEDVTLTLCSTATNRFVLRRKDGLVAVRPRQGATAIPLLASTKRLLNLLQEDAPTDDADDDDDDDDDIVMATSSMDVDKDGTASTDLQQLEACAALPESMEVALQDIGAFKERDYSNKKDKSPRGGGGREEARIKALEMRQQRLQKHLSNASKEDRGPAAPDDDSDVEMVDAEEEDDLAAAEAEAQEELEEAVDPWLRFFRAFNSLVVVTPILQDILFHPQRNNKGLRLSKGKVGITGKGKARCFLLGNHVFGITSVVYAKRIFARLPQLWTAMGATTKESDNEPLDMDGCLRQVQQTILLLRSKEVSELPWCRFDPLNGLLTIPRAQFNQLAKEWDSACGLDKVADPNMQKRYQKAINKLHSRLSGLLKSKFPDAQLSIYGSCLSDLSLGHSADVDLSLHFQAAVDLNQDFDSGAITAEEYSKRMRKFVFNVHDHLARFGKEFQKLQPITRARVPLVKGMYRAAENPYTKDGSINFDICFLNDIAVANSRLLREYSLVDPRVKQLMIEVKKWAKDNNINSAPDSTLSSYAWINLVIYYLQCLGMVPNLQSRALAKEVGMGRDMSDRWHSVNSLNTFFLSWEDASKAWKQPVHVESLSVTILLFGFFQFYGAKFPHHLLMIAIHKGDTAVLPKTAFRSIPPLLCIEDPFETFDSHTPHDLTAPTDFPNMERILRCFRASYEYLRTEIKSIIDDAGSLSSHVVLWKSTSSLDKARDSNRPRQHKNNRPKSRPSTTPSKGSNVKSPPGSAKSNAPTTVNSSSRNGRRPPRSIEKASGQDSGKAQNGKGGRQEKSNRRNPSKEGNGQDGSDAAGGASKPSGRKQRRTRKAAKLAATNHSIQIGQPTNPGTNPKHDGAPGGDAANL